MPKINRSPDVNDSKSSNDLESKEKINNSVYVIYRDNNLYQTLIPKIVENLEKVGKKVIQRSFPAGTPEEEIKKYFEDEKVKDSLKNTELLSDNTCYKNLPGGYEFYSENNTKKSLGILDELSKEIIKESLIGKPRFELSDTEMKEKENKLEVSSEMNVVKNILKSILEKKGEPERLYIVEDKISDHGFKNKLFNITKQNFLKSIFFKEKYGEELIKIDSNNSLSWGDKEKNKFKLLEDVSKSFNSQELERLIKNDILFNQTVELGFNENELVNKIESVLKGEMDDKEIIKIWNKFIANKLKDNIKDLINEEKIKIVPNAYDVEKGDENYVLVDGHAKYDYTLQKQILSNKVIIPNTPTELIDWAISNEILDVNFDIDEVIKSKIEAVFKKEE